METRVSCTFFLVDFKIKFNYVCSATYADVFAFSASSLLVKHN